jgi:hypothetical protein
LIKDRDRSGYIGASDTKFVVGNWKTKTFENWWLEKLGLSRNNFSNKYTEAGNNYEHKIIDALNIPFLEKDNQFVKGRLRVNLDANTKNKIHEIKTYNHEKGFDLKRHKDYVNQVQVQMYVSGIHNAEIDAYGLLESDYKNYFNEIDKSRLSKHEIDYDEMWIRQEYLPKFNYLEECLIRQKFPSREEFEETIPKLLKESKYEFNFKLIYHYNGYYYIGIYAKLKKEKDINDV